MMGILVDIIIWVILGMKILYAYMLLGLGIFGFSSFEGCFASGYVNEGGFSPFVTSRPSPGFVMDTQRKARMRGSSLFSDSFSGSSSVAPTQNVLDPNSYCIGDDGEHDSAKENFWRISDTGSTLVEQITFEIKSPVTQTHRSPFKSLTNSPCKTRTKSPLAKRERSTGFVVIKSPRKSPKKRSKIKENGIDWSNFLGVSQTRQKIEAEIERRYNIRSGKAVSQYGEPEVFWFDREAEAKPFILGLVVKGQVPKLSTETLYLALFSMPEVSEKTGWQELLSLRR